MSACELLCRGREEEEGLEDEGRARCLGVLLTVPILGLLAFMCVRSAKRASLRKGVDNNDTMVAREVRGARRGSGLRRVH